MIYIFTNGKITLCNPCWKILRLDEKFKDKNIEYKNLKMSFNLNISRNINETNQNFANFDETRLYTRNRESKKVYFSNC